MQVQTVILAILVTNRSNMSLFRLFAVATLPLEKADFFVSGAYRDRWDCLLKK